MSFLPNDYDVPQADSKYMKLQDGDNTFRVLGSAIVGFEYWNVENKPVRSQRRPETIPSDIRVNDNGEPSQIKHFWAFPVYNYGSNLIQVLEITQKSIQNSIKALVDNQRWGDPKEYDITITRTGEDLNTRYSVVPNPKSELDGEVSAKFAGLKLNLEALFTGEDPFEVKE